MQVFKYRLCGKPTNQSIQVCSAGLEIEFGTNFKTGFVRCFSKKRDSKCYIYTLLLIVQLKIQFPARLVLTMGNINITFHTCVVYLFVMTCSSAQSVPAFFIFGDSAADVGNNNYVATAAKGNTLPNGIDFGNPTGRFTNGRTVFDILRTYL